MKISKKAQVWLEEMNRELDDCATRIVALGKKMSECTSDDERFPVWKECQDVQSRMGQLALFTSALNGSTLYANEIMYSDVNPYEVVEMKTPNCWMIRAMKAEEKSDAREKRLDSFVPGGFCGHFDNYLQEWDITSIEDGTPIEIRRHKDGRWYHKGQGFSIEATPRKFYDFNF